MRHTNHLIEILKWYLPLTLERKMSCPFTAIGNLVIQTPSSEDCAKLENVKGGCFITLIMVPFTVLQQQMRGGLLKKKGLHVLGERFP